MQLVTCTFYIRHNRWDNRVIVCICVSLKYEYILHQLICNTLAKHNMSQHPLPTVQFILNIMLEILFIKFNRFYTEAEKSHNTRYSTWTQVQCNYCIIISIILWIAKLYYIYTRWAEKKTNVSRQHRQQLRSVLLVTTKQFKQWASQYQTKMILLLLQLVSDNYGHVYK